MNISNNFVILKTVDGLVSDKWQSCKTCKTTDEKVMHRSIFILFFIISYGSRISQRKLYIQWPHKNNDILVGHKTPRKNNNNCETTVQCLCCTIFFFFFCSSTLNHGWVLRRIVLYVQIYLIAFCPLHRFLAVFFNVHRGPILSYLHSNVVKCYYRLLCHIM